MSYLSNFTNTPASNVKSASSVINIGKTYQYVDNGEPMRGGMKDVYFGPDKSYVVAFYRDKQDFNSRERLKKTCDPVLRQFFQPGRWAIILKNCTAGRRTW